VGGITADDKSHVIRIGRAWDGSSGDQGPWDEPDGYRTLAHEFGHYALYLYDEYFAYTFDQNGNLTGDVPAYCTGPENRDPATGATNASVMDYQYTSSELSARSVPGLWSDLCEATAQWQLNGESCWETLTRIYTDTVTPPRWQFTTPAGRGAVMAGPEGLPSARPDWSQVEIHQEGPSVPPRLMTIYGPQGPYWGAIVALYKQDGRVIGQGFSDSNGQLDVYGTVEWDTLRAASFDGGLSGSVVVSTGMTLTLTLEPVGGLAAQAAGGIPYMRVVAEPGQEPSQIDLLVFLHNLSPGADPSVIVTAPRGEAGYAPALSYSSDTGVYEGEIGCSATERGRGRIRVATLAAQHRREPERRAAHSRGPRHLRHRPFAQSTAPPIRAAPGHRQDPLLLSGSGCPSSRPPADARSAASAAGDGHRHRQDLCRFPDRVETGQVRLAQSSARGAPRTGAFLGRPGGAA
jgi:hypothetical protein